MTRKAVLSVSAFVLLGSLVFAGHALAYEPTETSVVGTWEVDFQAILDAMDPAERAAAEPLLAGSSATLTFNADNTAHFVEDHGAEPENRTGTWSATATGSDVTLTCTSDTDGEVEVNTWTFIDADTATYQDQQGKTITVRRQ